MLSMIVNAAYAEFCFHPLRLIVWPGVHSLDGLATIFTCFNTRADAIANSLLDGTMTRWSIISMCEQPSRLVVNYDGGKRGNAGVAASAWTLQGAYGNSDFRVLAEGGVIKDSHTTVTDAELMAQEEGVKAGLSFILHGTVRWEHEGYVLL